MEQPYVISAELDAPTSRIAPYVKVNNIEQARRELIDDLQKMNKNVLVVSSQEITSGLTRIQSQTTLPSVSLDSTYTTNADLHIGISRGIDKTLADTSYAPRAGFDALSDQLDQIASLGSEVQIIDDVVFSGEMMLWLNRQLKARSVKIGRVICGIAINEGVEALSNTGIDVESVYSFDAVEDELCERDLFLAPGSGRRIADKNANALYFDTTYGKPSQWASIPPDYAADFFLRSLERSLRIVEPSVPLSKIGTFLGYQDDLTVEAAIRARLKEEQ